MVVPCGDTTSASVSNTTGSITILYVDGQAGFAGMVAEFLEGKYKHFNVATTTSASSGMDILSQNEIDCVVSEYQISGIDGLKFLKKVRKKYFDLPFILFTGKGSEEVASDAIAAGVTDYLKKDPKSDQFTVLAARIERAIHKFDPDHRHPGSRQHSSTILDNPRSTRFDSVSSPP